jgi:hypothetical protein
MPTHDSLHGKCPRCGLHANFNLVNHDILGFKPDGTFSMSAANAGRPVPRGQVTERVSVVECMGCHEKSVVIEAQEGEQQGLTSVLYWPTDHLADSEQIAGVPGEIVTAYSEGLRCLAAKAPNAAVAMFRTVIAQIVENKGSEAAKAKRNLFDRIEQMVQDKTLWDDFGDWAHHVRDTGNAGAHGEKFDPVTMEQAAELRNFIREMVNFLYVQPARRTAARPVAKKAPPAPGSGQA